MGLVSYHPYKKFPPVIDYEEVLWTPQQITTALWLDAADTATITLNGSTVSEWNDKSGNARHASQATPLNQPTYQATGFNNLPTISFDGVNDQFDLVQFAQVSGQNIFAVVDTTSIGAAFRTFLNRTSGTANNMALLLGGDSSTDYKPSIYWNGSPRAAWGSAIQRKAIVRWSFATGASALTQVDDAAVATSTFTASELTNWESICVASVQQCNIKLSELIITPITPDSITLAKIQGYLANKWAITTNLSVFHLYKSKPPVIEKPLNYFTAMNLEGR